MTKRATNEELAKAVKEFSRVVTLVVPNAHYDWVLYGGNKKRRTAYVLCEPQGYGQVFHLGYSKGEAVQILTNMIAAMRFTYYANKP